MSHYKIKSQKCIKKYNSRLKFLIRKITTGENYSHSDLLSTVTRLLMKVDNPGKNTWLKVEKQGNWTRAGKPDVCFFVISDRY